MHHHRLGLQPILAQENSTAQNHCLTTTTRLARGPIQSVHQSSEMVGLGRTPAPAPTSLAQRSYPVRPKHGRTACGQLLGRRLRSHHSNRVRVPRMFMARLSQLFPRPTRPLSHLPHGSHPARSVRSHVQETRSSPTTRLPSPDPVGV